MKWNKTYAGTGLDEMHSLIQTMDGGFALGGCSIGNVGDFWLDKTDSSGNVQWQTKYGGATSEYAFSLTQTGARDRKT